MSLRRFLGLTTAAALATGGWVLGPTAPAQADPRTDPPGVQLREMALTKKSPKARVRLGSAQKTTSDQTVVAELPAKDVSTFSTVGVTWATATDHLTVEVRTRTAGTWSDWSALGDSVDETAGQDASTQERSGTDPVYVGESDAIAVRMLGAADATVTDPQLSLIDTPSTTSDARLATTAATSVPGMAAKPAIVTRAGWGANESWRSINSGCSTPKIDSTIQAAIVHHTAGSNSYSSSQSASIVRGIYAYHVKSLGWCDIGYNFLIDKYGKVFEGRYGGVDKPVHGAHATSWNTNTVGVSMMGNYDTARPPAVMLESVAKVIAWKFDGNYRDPRGKVTLAGKYINRIAAHRDVMSTACPGRYGYAALPGLRDRVAALAGSWKTPIWARWQAMGGDSGAAGSPYIGEKVIADGRITQFTKYDMFSSVDTGAYYTKGSIRTRYRALGTATSPLRFPVSDETTGPVDGSRQNLFEGGAIIHSSGNGSQEIYGGIWRTYRDLGTPGTRVGVPLKPEYTSSTAGVPVQDFSKGRIYWISSSGRAVYGSIWTEYKRMGADTSALRRPVSSEEAGPVSGSRQSRFEKGIILYSSGTGARAVTGSIHTAWNGLSSANKARLGLPTTAPVATSAGLQQTFQYGVITATSSGAKVTFR